MSETNHINFFTLILIFLIKCKSKMMTFLIYHFHTYHCRFMKSLNFEILKWLNYYINFKAVRY
jgi:hypothetical protein